MIALDLIPLERRETARSALTAAFGASPVTDLRTVTGGGSGALTYRVETGGRPYLLRLETARDTFRNPQRSYVCMQTASDAGLAPPLRYADPVAGVAIMDFLPQQSLFDYPTGREGLVRDLGQLTARLQTTPVFPPLYDYPVIVRGLLDYLRAPGLFAPGLLDPHLEGFERIRAAYPWDGAALVSGHNDPNPSNIIFDGERLWLVDWEMSFRNDPLADVAILSQYFAPTPELEEVMLQAWLGRSPDRLLRARLLLMRQFTRLYYAGIALSTAVGFAPRPAPYADLEAPTVAEFHGDYARPKGAAELLYTLGRAYLRDFLDGLSAPGFEDALVIARRG